MALVGLTDRHPRRRRPVMRKAAFMLELREVTKRYGKRVAVDGLNLQVTPGEILGLLGPNGAGKSTTVHLAVGCLKPDSGRVTVDGRAPADEPSVRARIGVAPQTLSLYELLTGEENLRFLGRMHGCDRSSLRQRAAEALAFVGLSDRATDRVRTYSGGMKRRLNLAAALLHDPDLLLLDEPTVGVDPQSRNAIFENLLAMKAAGKAIVYTTHHMEEASRLCDRVAVIDRGRLLALDTVAGLLAAHGGTATLLVRTLGEEHRIQADNPLAELNRIAATTQVTSFQVEHATLEQVFLNLTGRRLRD
jgi:ABC-2 type transport system ATP-binding protein